MNERVRHPYGSVRDAVAEWLDGVPEGHEFHYGDVASDLGLQLPTVSASMLKAVREPNARIIRGSKSGWYKKLSVAAAPTASEQVPQGIKPEDLLEVVGKYKNGNILLRAADGSLWEANQVLGGA